MLVALAATAAAGSEATLGSEAAAAAAPPLAEPGGSGASMAVFATVTTAGHQVVPGATARQQVVPRATEEALEATAGKDQVDELCIPDFQTPG